MQEEKKAKQNEKCKTKSFKKHPPQARAGAVVFH